MIALKISFLKINSFTKVTSSFQNSDLELIQFVWKQKFEISHSQIKIASLNVIVTLMGGGSSLWQFKMPIKYQKIVKVKNKKMKNAILIEKVYPSTCFFYKQQLHRKHQTETDKQPSKSLATPWGSILSSKKQWDTFWKMYKNKHVSV